MDLRANNNGQKNMRRRECNHCGYHFTTCEIAEDYLYLLEKDYEVKVIEEQSEIEAGLYESFRICLYVALDLGGIKEERLELLKESLDGAKGYIQAETYDRFERLYQKILDAYNRLDDSFNFWRRDLQIDIKPKDVEFRRKDFRKMVIVMLLQEVNCFYD